MQLISLIFIGNVILQKLKEKTIRVHQYPTIIGGCTMSLIHVLEGDKYFYFNFSFLTGHGWLQFFLMILNLMCCCLSWSLIYMYGFGNFDRIEYSGPYSIGYTMFYLKSASQNPVRVYYPVDKSFEASVQHYKSEIYKPYLDFRDTSLYFRAHRFMMRILSRYGPARYRSYSQCCFYSSSYHHFIENMRTQAITMAHLAYEFKTG